MKGAILEKQDMDYTYMNIIFSAMGNFQLNYNWLISDYECNCHPSELIPFNQPYTWISGDEFTQIVEKHEIQFIWGAFSGFQKHYKLEEILKADLPYADGCTTFWSSDLKIQHPLADIEMVSWDATSFLFISRESILTDLFIKGFPLSEDLADYNRLRGR